jgi:hypothetical protein
VKRRLPFAGVAALGLAWAVAAPAAYAEGDGSAGDGRFALEVKACPNLSTDSVRRILGIEVGDLLLPESSDAPTKADRLTIRCSGSFAWVQASGQAGGTPAEQVVSLDDLPGDAAPRVLALAGLELLATLNSTVRARMASKHEAPPPATALAATPEPGVASAASARETRIGLAGAWRLFLAEHGASAWGGQVQIHSTVGELWLLSADAELAGARNPVPGIGEASALLISCGAWFGLRRGSGRLGASFGLGGRLGAVRLSGDSADPATVTGATVWHPWGGPMATAGIVGRAGRFALGLRAESGYALVEANGLAGGATAITVRGAWAAIMLGGGIRP